ncbi:hypothetical protein B0H10DRAFT_2214317 [Mycena sp. CBHHK59/15]|nr:hypothetical protein B0H10DRAFT_2214317 [Mycena sp. CBHHK59/15]
MLVLEGADGCGQMLRGVPPRAATPTLRCDIHLESWAGLDRTARDAQRNNHEKENKEKGKEDLEGMVRVKKKVKARVKEVKVKVKEAKEAKEKEKKVKKSREAKCMPPEQFRGWRTGNDTVQCKHSILGLGRAQRWKGEHHEKEKKESERRESESRQTSEAWRCTWLSDVFLGMLASLVDVTAFSRRTCSLPAGHEDTVADSVLTLLDAATNDLAQLIMHLDLKVTPGTPTPAKGPIVPSLDPSSPCGRMPSCVLSPMPQADMIGWLTVNMSPPRVSLPARALRGDIPALPHDDAIPMPVT